MRNSIGSQRDNKVQICPPLHKSVSVCFLRRFIRFLNYHALFALKHDVICQTMLKCIDKAWLELQRHLGNHACMVGLWPVGLCMKSLGHIHVF